MPRPCVVGHTVAADPPVPNPLGLVPGPAAAVPLVISSNVRIDSKLLVNVGTQATVAGCIAAGGYTLSAPVAAVLNANPSHLSNDSQNVLLDDATRTCPGGVMTHPTLPPIMCIGCVFKVSNAGQSSCST